MKKVTHRKLSAKNKEIAARKKMSSKPVSKLLKTEMRKLLEVLQARVAKLERQNAELIKINKEQQKTSEHCSILLERSSLGITVEREDKIVYMNPSANKMIGSSPSKNLIDKPITDLVHPDFYNLVRDGTVSEDSLGIHLMEMKFIKMDGTAMDVKINRIPIVHDRVETIYYIWDDTTEQNKVQTALFERDKHLRGIMTTAMDGIITVDGNQRILFFNPAAEKMFDYPATKVIGQKLDMLLPSDKRAIHKKKIQEFGKSKTTTRSMRGFAEVSAVRANGEFFPVEASISQFDIDGKKFFTSILRDITDRKQAEFMLKLQNDEILISKEKIQEIDRLKTAFLANMSHELRTPLNGILASAEYLAGKVQEPKFKLFVNNIINAGSTLLSLISDILDLSKIEAGKIQITETEVNPHELIRELSCSFSVQQKINQIQFIETISPLPTIIIVDGVRLRQILYNLLGNAFKFTNRGSIELIVSCLENQYLKVEVKDTGIGIAEDQQELIFEPFHQQDRQNNAKYGGTGLGLSITKRLVEAMRGTITLQSKRKVGSVFTVTLPYRLKENNMDNNDVPN